MTGPLVSVVIPAFNTESFISEALASVLAQGVADLEILVIDDGSTDATAERAAETDGVRVIRRPNGGIGAARNTGVSVAEGEFIAFLDSDDVWTGGRLSKMLRAIDSFEAVFGQAVQFGADREETLPQPALLASTMLVRRDAYDRVGPFVEALRVGEFIDWWARAEECGLRWSQIPDVVLRRRIHSTNTGIVQAANRVDYARVLRAALERRRGAQ